MGKIALDAMGGDHAPDAIVEGAVMAARELDVEIVLVGNEEIVRASLARHATQGLSISVVHAPQQVEMHESPSSVVRRKRESSIWIATRLVKTGDAVAVVSAGNTGASMATALFILGPLSGVERPAIATLLPTLTGTAILIDVGANVDCKPEHLFQFGIMGYVYARDMLGMPAPKVGLLSIGEEEGKGNDLTREVFKMLKESGLPFIGNVEGRDVYRGGVDVIVCDGFIGNVALKISEGLADALVQMLKREILSSTLGKLGGLLLRPTFARFRKKIDYAEYGGAPLLGVNGVSVICHGRSTPKAIKNAIRVARDAADRGLNGHIKEQIEAGLKEHAS
jgi:glycerol-3-phosphate acyltransferase PlsX